MTMAGWFSFLLFVPFFAMFIEFLMDIVHGAHMESLICKAIGSLPSRCH